jgi:hypothetical protein
VKFIKGDDFDIAMISPKQFKSVESDLPVADVAIGFKA